MKMIINFSVVLVLFLTAICVNQVSAQSAQKSQKVGQTIPVEVSKIVVKSCGNCHSEPGMLLALAKVNLSKWDNYSPEKQAAKSKAMYNKVSKGQMPPRKFRRKHPEAIPTPGDIKTILDWAKLLQVTKK